MAAPVSRRTVFKAVLATTAGGMAAMIGLGRANAQYFNPAPHSPGSPCQPPGASKFCETGYCVPGPNGFNFCGCPPASVNSGTTNVRCTNAATGQVGCFTCASGQVPEPNNGCACV